MRDMKQKENYKIDIANTFFGNLFWLFLMFFVVIFVFIGASYINTLEGREKIMFLIVWMFITFKLIIWCGHPKVSFIKREI